MDDLLLTFAEVAVAFAGFASIASVLGRQRSVQARLRLQMLLIYSLSVLFLSLLPAAGIRSGFPPAASWRSASAALAISTAVALAGPLRRLSGTLRASGVPYTRYLPLLLALQLGPIVVCGAGALGAWQDQLPIIFVLSLAALLFVSAIVFARLVLALLADPPPAA